MKLHFIPWTLEFKHPFGISSGTRNTTPVVFTKLEWEGLIGYGEASLPPYLGATQESVMAFLKKAAPVLENKKDPLRINEILQEIDGLSKSDAAAKASIDIALHDLTGKIMKKPWHKIWELDPHFTPYTTYTIGIGDPELLPLKIEEAAPYKILKVKLGTADDKALIERIRSFTDKPLVVDVNQGWHDTGRAIDMTHWLAQRNVLFVEQPMPVSMKMETGMVTAMSPIPVIADESVQRLGDIHEAASLFSGINIKLMKCTGMHEAYRMIRQAREYGLKVFIGCMSETSCAVSAAAQLTPLADWADLDGPLLIKQDLFDGVTFEKGKITLNDAPGIGVTPKKDLTF